MKILICATNHNTCFKTFQYLSSIESAIKPKNLSLKILIADNSTIQENCFDKDKFSFEISIVKTENLGYINSIEFALHESQTNIKEYDYFIISNVDLKISYSFFKILNEYSPSKNIGWIAPKIISEKECLDRNPKIISKPKKNKLVFLHTLYSIPLLYYIYTLIFYPIRRRKKISKNPKFIYAGHGSFMIFTKVFSNSITSIKYFNFLFNEEIFFAELCLGANLKVVHKKKLIINDSDHASTSKLKKSRLMRLNKISIKNIIKKYYE